MNLEEIENNNRAAKSRRKIAGFSDKRWMEEIDWLIAEVKPLREENRELIDKYLEIGYLVKTISGILEGKEPSDFMLSYPLVREVADKVSEVKRLRSVCQEEHERFLLALSDCQNKDFEIDKLQAENERFREYVVKTGCSYTQTEDGIECDYEYPWLCDHCPVLEHNKAIDTEMKVGNDNHN